MNNLDYLNQRLGELGITPEQNTFERVWINVYNDKDDQGNLVVKESEQRRTYETFKADDEGNIIISYFDLHGQPYRWKKEDAKMPIDYTRIRLREVGIYKGKKLNDPNQKYLQAHGSPQFPFFNKSIIEKFSLAKKGDERGVITTLFLVEGEFKSFKGSLCGVDIIGLPSIHGFYNGDVKGKLHEDIQELIITCKVAKIVFLVDADLLSVKWEEDKDLAKRPASFFGAVKAFRESLQLLLDDDTVPLQLVYFMHLNTKYMADAKGLDDLLCKYTAQTVEIIEDLYSLAFAKKYFTGRSILDQNKDINSSLYRYLGLTDEQEFYKTYREFISAREFKFKRRRYVWNEEAKEVVFVRHEDAEKFMRIGPDWVKVITKPNPYGEPEEEIVPWKITEIARDYKKFPDFIDQIQKYDDFCNEPNWNGEYKRVINGCYNLCSPLRWKPENGSIKNTIKFLKHIFQGKGSVTLNEYGQFVSEEAFLADQFTVALDYLAIMFRYPKQMLPVPILVSPENYTGKSTFLKWLQSIYSNNMCILGNEQFKMKFNGHYITKFIIAIDEGFLEVDKKAEKERLKQLVTADSAYLENKGMNVRKINYYGKLIICSNDADRVMKIEEGESRWFVVRVPKVGMKKMRGSDVIKIFGKSFEGKEVKEDETYEVPDLDPDLLVRMREEIPAFLKFLSSRPIFHPRSHRLWFYPEWFITDQFRIIVDTTKNRVDRVFEDWLCEQFMMFKMPVLRYPAKYLVEVFNDQKNSKYKIDAIELKNYLAQKGLEPEETQWVKIPKGFKETLHTDGESAQPIEQNIIQWISGPGRPYVFRAENWLSPAQLETIGLKKPPLSKDDEVPF